MRVQVRTTYAHVVPGAQEKAVTSIGDAIVAAQAPRVAGGNSRVQTGSEKGDEAASDCTEIAPRPFVGAAKRQVSAAKVP